jgi:hypothetical protein
MVTVAAKTAQPQPAGGGANPYAHRADPEGETLDTKA